MYEDQAVHGAIAMQLTYAIIHDKSVRESKEDPIVKDDSLLAAPHLLHPDIPSDSATIDFKS